MRSVSGMTIEHTVEVHQYVIPLLSPGQEGLFVVITLLNTSRTVETFHGEEGRYRIRIHSAAPLTTDSSLIQLGGSLLTIERLESILPINVLHYVTLILRYLRNTMSHSL